MDNNTFERYIEDIIERISDTLIVKGGEYSRNNDRLHNFNIGAQLTNQTRERVLDGFMLKHYISYRDMLNDLENNRLPTKEYVEEKIGDLLIYFMLMEVSLKDKIKTNEEGLTEGIEEQTRFI